MGVMAGGVAACGGAGGFYLAERAVYYRESYPLSKSLNNPK